LQHLDHIFGSQSSFEKLSKFLLVIENRNAVRKADGKENWVFDFVSDVGCCQIVIETLWIIFYLYFLFSPAFVFSLYELFL
jgi:hypothetical protein